MENIITMDDIITDLSMLRPVVINEQNLNARIYYVPVIKEGKIFIGYYTNRTLMYDEYGFARVNIVNPHTTKEQDTTSVQLVKRKQEEYDEAIILEVKEIMYDKLKIYSNHFIKIGAYLNFLEN